MEPRAVYKGFVPGKIRYCNSKFPKIFELKMRFKYPRLGVLSKISRMICNINDKIHQANKGVGLLRKLHTILPRNNLLTIHKSFIRPFLDYADLINDQPSNASFAKKIESVQYNAALAIIGAIKGSSRKKLYQELGLEYLYRRRCARRLCLLYIVLWSVILYL